MRANITDVEKLLEKHFGLEWKERGELQFYWRIIRGPTIEENQIKEYLC